MSTEDSLSSKEKIKKATQLLNEVQALELSEDEFKEVTNGVNMLLMADVAKDIVSGGIAAYNAYNKGGTEAAKAGLDAAAKVAEGLQKIKKGWEEE